MLTGSSSDLRSQDRAERIRQIVFEAERKWADGEAISEGRIVVEHADLMPELAEELDKLRRIHGVLEEVEDAKYHDALARLRADWAGDRARGAAGEFPTDSATPHDPEFADRHLAEIAAADESTSLPTVIGRYRVRQVLGEGAFGRVYLASDDDLARDVAIKVPHPQQVAAPEDVAAYLAEARIVAGLDHPAIVPVYDVGRTSDGRCYVVAKWIRGSDLQSRLRRGNVSQEEAARIVMAVADALDYAHLHGLVHRDIKPANILLDAEGRPFVADFGLALQDPEWGVRRSFAGTPAYMSPEQARGEAHRVDGRSDIFSLGVVLYELLTGHKPFQSELRDELLQQIVFAEPTPPRHRDASVDGELERICLKMLAKRAADRYATARELVDDLQHFLDCTASRSSRSASAVGLGAAATLDVPPVPKIVPKGLRPFDANDAVAYLTLVPGPRDREGLPASIRQWKSRIEQDEADETFAVGVLYGPSGCGKSSLVRAGLLPRLSARVHVLYVEATADDTEARLLRKLLRSYPDLSAVVARSGHSPHRELGGSGVRESEAKVREGEAKVREGEAKVREGEAPAEPGHWPPGHRDPAQQELRPPGRHPLTLADTLAAVRSGRGPTPGSKLLIVLDQFEQWLHGKGESDRRLLVQALRQCDGPRLQCLLLVRDDFWLALSRFMTELEIDLSQRHNTALVDLFDPAHARRVLAEFGRAYGQLPEDLSQLNPPQEAFLQRAIAGLSHADTVVPVRLALFAEMIKSKPWNPATLRDVGGAAGVGVTFLEETFSARTANPQHRLHEQAARAVLEALLPASGSDLKGRIRSYPELLDISGYGQKPRAFKELMRILDSETRLLTPTDPDVEGRGLLPAQSGQRFYQLTHDYLVPALRQWLTQKQQATRSGRTELCLAERSAMWSARPERRQLPALWEWLSIRWLTRSAQWTAPQRRMMRSATRWYTFSAGVVVALVLFFLSAGLEVTGPTRDLLLRFRARSAAFWLAVGREDAVWPLLKHSPDPTLRTRLIHGLSPLVIDPETVVTRSDRQSDASVRRAMLLVAGELAGDPENQTGTRAELRRAAPPQKLLDRLLTLYRDDPDPGLHAAAEWALRRYEQDEQIVRADRQLVSTGIRGDRQWYVNGQGHTLVVIPGPTQFLMGAPAGEGPEDADQRQHSRWIRRSFCIASKETTVEQFQRFLQDHPAVDRGPAGSAGLSPGQPQTSVTWYAAAAYCNWLSQLDEVPRAQWCYVPDAEGRYAAGMRVAADSGERRGYRLPTEAEWEYACRAGATTAHACGDAVTYLHAYAVFGETGTSQPRLVGRTKPNDFGLFDMQGNAAEWCQDVYGAYPSADGRPSAGEREPVALSVQNSDLPVLRGGSFRDAAEQVRCAARDKARPTARRDTIGFRVARSYP